MIAGKKVVHLKGAAGGLLTNRMSETYKDDIVSTLSNYDIIVVDGDWYADNSFTFILKQLAEKNRKSQTILFFKKVSEKEGHDNILTKLNERVNKRYGFLHGTSKRMHFIPVSDEFLMNDTANLNGKWYREYAGLGRYVWRYMKHHFKPERQDIVFLAGGATAMKEIEMYAKEANSVHLFRNIKTQNKKNKTKVFNTNSMHKLLTNQVGSKYTARYQS